MGRSFKRPSRAPASRSAHACAAADGSGGGSSPAGGGGSSSTGCWPAWAAQGSGATACRQSPAALPQAARRQRRRRCSWRERVTSQALDGFATQSERQVRQPMSRIHRLPDDLLLQIIAIVICDGLDERCWDWVTNQKALHCVHLRTRRLSFRS